MHISNGRPALSRFLILLGAAIFVPVAASAQPTVLVSPTSISVQTPLGTNAASQTVQVSNGGNRALKWTVVQPSVNWVSVSPTTGVNKGTVRLNFSTSALALGTHNTTFQVQGGSGAPATVSVQVNVVPAQDPPPPGTLTVTCPSNISVASTNGTNAVVNYTVTTSGGAQPVTWTGTPASGTAFPIGTTAVQVNATSNDGQTASCGFSVTVTSTPPPQATGVGPQSTITCPAGAVDIFPGTFINSVVELHPAGTTFCFRAGTHNLDRSIVPKTGNTFVGQFGAILNGTWTTIDDTEAAFRAQSQDIDSVTISNLVIQNFRRGIHAAAPSSSHWTIEFNEIANNFSGIVFPSDSRVRNNNIHHNFNSGYFGSFSHNSVVEKNVIANNGWEQKISESVNVKVQNNHVHHNEGAGIWFDANNTGSLIEDNVIEDNGHAGIWYEISGSAIIRNNTIRRSGDTGLYISTSKDTEIYGNTLEGNFRGITYFLNCAAVTGGNISFDLANNNAHDNTIIVGTQSGALASVFSYTGACTVAQVTPYKNGSKNLKFTNNTYDVPVTTGQYWLWDAFIVWSQWQGLGHDLTGIVK